MTSKAADEGARRSDTRVPAIDSVWREDDARALRHVRVVAIIGDKAQLEKVVWNQNRGIWEPEGTRVTYAALRRFGKSSGYKPVSP